MFAPAALRLCLLLLLGSFLPSACMPTSSLAQMMQRLERARQYGLQLQQTLETLDSKLSMNRQNEYSAKCEQPSMQYEFTRKRLHRNIVELWYYLSRQLPRLANQTLLLQLAERKRALLIAMQQLPTMDGYANWREMESQQLSAELQQRLHKLQQHPVQANMFNCTLPDYCNFGCRLHMLSKCLIIGYASGRAVSYDVNKWQAYESLLESPLAGIEVRENTQWAGVIYLRLAVPTDVAKRLMRLHGAPLVWWVGQFVQYLLQPQPMMQEIFHTALSQLELKRPIVGLHIRRTDKIFSEASSHSLDEYMQYAEDYFQMLDMHYATKVQRRILLATDDAGAEQEARAKYAHYEIIANLNHIALAAEERRESQCSLKSIVLDIYLLAHSDFVVCTLSSNVCRLVYEMMQTLHVDAELYLQSLDEIYYFSGQIGSSWRALMPHKPYKFTEIELQPNDILHVAGNHWDGFSSGTNQRTMKTGLFPSFKVLPIVKTMHMLPANKNNAYN